MYFIMKHALVEKFENIKITQEQLLPAVDIKYCKNEQRCLDGTLAQLKEWQTFFEEKDAVENNPAYRIENKYRSGDEREVKDVYRYSYDRPEDWNVYDRFKYTVKYSLVKIDQLRSDIKSLFIERIVKYFNDKYGLDIPDIRIDNEATADKFLKYDIIIEHIRIHLGGHLNFNMVSIDKAIKAFRKQIYSSQRVELKGKQLHLQQFVWYSGNLPRFDLDFRDNYLKVLNDAIAIYETDETRGPDYAFGSAIHGQPIDFEKDYVVINGSRIEGVRFYKNRKVALKFIDAQAAKDFYNRFQLSSF